MSEPRRTGLLNMLGSSLGCQFVIPVYQRNYTWSANREVRQYLSDLKNVLDGKYKNHFLGIIIYLEKPIDFATREFSVIDGQQRLTTTFLIIYAVKKILEKNGDNEKVQQLEGQYLTNPYHTDKIKYKLKPLVSDDDIYRNIVEDKFDQIEDSYSNVYKNYRYIEEYLNTLLMEGYSANDILLALDKLYVVTVPISEEDNAQKIFESINATGVKLTSADLIRNYLLMDLPSDIQEKYYRDYWRKIEDNVSSNSKELEMFFRMYLAIKKFTLVAKSAVYREFVDWTEGTAVETEKLFKELLEYAQIYNQLINEEIKKLPNSLKIPVTDFRKIASDIPLSIIMEFYHLYRQNLLSDIVLGDLIYSINTFLLRRSICDMDSQNISKLFPTLLKKVLDKCNNDYAYILKVLNQEMVGNNANTSGSYMPTDKQMMEYLLNASVYKRPALRIVLDRLELHDNPAPVDLEKLSIEHLMPQTPTEEWLEELDTDEETYYENLHRIGNLTLAAKSDNSKMGNMNWDYKNAVLKGTSHLKLNEEIIPVAKWDLKAIDERSESLINKICDVFPYPDVSIAKADNGEMVDEKEALETCRVLAFGSNNNVKEIKKGKTYKSDDNKNGYTLTTSKKYIQGNREKYWFGYREYRFEGINDCDNQYMVLGCRSNETTVVCFPKAFLKEKLDNMNVSYDDEGNPSHYHIVLFRDPDGSMSMLLSKPELKEINIDEFVFTKDNKKNE